MLHRLLVIVFSLPFVSSFWVYFFPSLISSVISWLFISMLFSIHMFVFFKFFFFLYLIINPIPLWLEKMLGIISISSIYWSLICDPRHDLSWKIYHVHLKRKYIQSLSGGMSYKNRFSLSGLMCHLSLHPSSIMCSVMSDTFETQVLLSLEFSRQEYWSGLPFLLQVVFPTDGSKLYLLCLLHC